MPYAPSFKTFTGYQATFSSWDGELWEQELTRAAIHAGALAASKLNPEVSEQVRSSHRKVYSAFRTAPNRYMGWSQFLYRLKTIYDLETTAVVIPQLAEDGETVNGLWPLKYDYAEVVDYADEPWVRLHLGSGDVLAIELRKVAILTKFQYESDFFGGGNAIDATMRLLHAQNEAEEKAIRMGANILYIGKVNGQMRETDIRAKRERFAEDNLSTMNRSGLMLYDQTFDSVEQVNHKSFVIDPEEMQRIERHVYTYFGVNEDILQNKYNEDTWDAFYEGNVEPFALQLADALNQMLFTPRERQMGNQVSFSSNRLQYMSAASKRNMIRDMLDRGVFSINDALRVLQMPPLTGKYQELGESHIVRGEYVDATILRSPVADDNAVQDLGGDDQIYGDTDAQNFQQEVDE